MTGQNTARIWILNIETNAWVRITLHEGADPLAFYTFEDTDEGYESQEAYYYLRNGVVVCEAFHNSRDCDGVHQSGTEVECPLDKLQALTDDPELPPRPEWKHRTSRNYDQYAEAAGY